MRSLFDELLPEVPITKGAVLLPGIELKNEEELFQALQGIIKASPFRQMITPNGFRMSVGMTNCGDHGWVTDLTGYRYDTIDPITQKSWPAIPEIFLQLATLAAITAGFPNFTSNACLINCYHPGAKLSLHQDKDESSLNLPIVSISLGLPATFLFGGLNRSGPKLKIPLIHGDVLVWGGPARLCYHGVLPIKNGEHSLLGRKRINLTFRNIQ